MTPAVIFDFDGVIADTEPLHWKAFQVVLEPKGMGCTWEEYVAEFIGFDDRDALRAAYQRGGLTLDTREMETLIRVKAEAFVAIASASREVIFPAAPRLIRACAEAGWRMAICSGALRGDIEAVLHGTALLDQFDVVVTANDVTVSKPDPESYHRAVEQLGIDPGRAVVLEDTPAGITAARRAGLPVVGIRSTHDAPALSDADHVVAGIEEVTPGLLLSVLNGR